MLGSRAYDIALSPRQEDARTYPDVLEARIVGEGREHPCTAVMDIAKTRKEGAHVGVHCPVGGVGSGIVTLIGIAGIDHGGLVEVLQPEAGLQIHLRVAVRGRSMSLDLNLLSNYQVLHNMRPAILDPPVLRGLGRS